MDVFSSLFCSSFNILRETSDRLNFLKQEYFVMTIIRFMLGAAANGF